MFGAVMGMVFVLGLPADDEPPAARAAQGPAVDTTADDLAAYNVRADRAGRDPEAHVRLALWCEARGLAPEREKHLTMAVRLDPEHAVARALLGHVKEDGKWRRPGEIAAREKADPARAALRAEYEAKRRVAPPTADDQARLAAWCESKGLAAEARAHFMTVVRIDPSRDNAWRALGYVRKDGRWATPSALARLDAERKAQVSATAAWVPRLERLVKELNRDATREQAENDLAAITDPRAVPAVMKVLGPRETTRAVQVLGQVDAPAASKALAYMAVFAADANVRRAAGESLRHRDPREFAGPLVTLLRDEIKFEVKPVAGPGSTGELWVEGQRYDRKRTYETMMVPPPQPGDQLMGFDDLGLPVFRRPLGWRPINTIPPRWSRTIQVPDGLEATYLDVARQWATSVAESQREFAREALGPLSLGGAERDQLANRLVQSFGPPVFVDDRVLPQQPGRGRNLSMVITTQGGGFQGFMLYEQQIAYSDLLRQAQASALHAQRTLEQDVAEIEAINRLAAVGNDRVRPLLAEAAGQDLGKKKADWDAWWVDLLGYAPQRQYPERPVLFDRVPAPLPSMPVVSRPIGAFLPGSTTISLARMSCFAAGTLVHARDGLKPIESIQVGDQVLAQDIDSGVLGYKPVTVVHHNPPIQTMKIATDAGSTATASIYHRFWSPGRGWVMARDLKPGDLVRTLGGTSRMASIETGETVPVFNLDVADAHSFFVAEAGFLVHDNSIPGLRLEPFDRVEVAAEETR